MLIDKIVFSLLVLIVLFLFVVYVIQIKRLEKQLIESLPIESKLKLKEYFKDE